MNLIIGGKNQANQPARPKNPSLAHPGQMRPAAGQPQSTPSRYRLAAWMLICPNLWSK